MTIRRLIALVLVAAAALVSGTVVAGAPREIVATAPEIVISGDVVAFESVAAAGDELVFYRYHLPAGYDSGGVAQAWQQYGTSGALARVMNGSASLQDRTPPALGYAIMADYLSSGTASWGSTTAFVRLQGNPALFANVGAVDQPLTYSYAGAESSTVLVDSSVRQGELCDAFQSMLQAVEQDDPDLNTGDLVSGGVVTEAGTQMVVNAFSAAAEILPDCFSVGTTSTGETFSPPSGQRESDAASAAEASTWWSRWMGFMNAYSLGGAAVLIMTGIIAVWSLVAWVVMVWLTGPAYGTIAALEIMLSGSLWVPQYLLQIVLVVVAMMGSLSIVYWWQRFPRG